RARRRRWAPGTQEPEPVVEALRDRSRPERAEPRRRELERERQAVEAEADAGDVDRCLCVYLEPGRGRGAALREQAHSLVVQKLARRELLLRIGDRERRHAE